MDEGLKKELMAFTCRRIDEISNIAKLDKDYLKYKSQEIELQNQFKNELSQEQQKEFIKLLDINYLKEAIIEEYLYRYGIHDGIQLKEKLNSDEF